MEEPRKNFNILLVGAQGCGKTTLFLKFIKAYLEANLWKRILIGVPDFAEEKLDRVPLIKLDDLITPRFRGIKKMLIRKPQKQKDSAWIKLMSFFLPDDENPNTPKPAKFNGLFVCDDARGIFNRRDETYLDFISRRRQTNMDFMSIWHGWDNEVPPSFFKWITKIIIFETADNPDVVAENISPDKKDAFWETYNRVQAVCKAGSFEETLEVIHPDKKDEYIAAVKKAGGDISKVNQYYYEELVIRKI